MKSDSNYRSPQRALPHLEKACDANHIRACYNLAVLYKKGDEGIPPNKELFKEYKRRTQELVKQYGSLDSTKKA